MGNSKISNRYKLQTVVANGFNHLNPQNDFMNFLRCLILFLGAAYSVSGQDITSSLVPPRIGDIVGFENSPIYNYSTDELKFELPREDVIRYLKNGKVLPFDYDKQKLFELSGWTPPEKMTAFQKRRIEDSWKKQGALTEVARMYAVATGAITTKDGKIFFWQKLNDRVLWLATWTQACYLVLPK